MSQTTKIEWTEATWNPITGCTKISPGCENCYAEKLACRLKAMGNRSYINGFDVTYHESMLKKPLLWTKPKKIFVNSMSDLFHEEICFQMIEKIFQIMNKANWHTYQILTKRIENVLNIDGEMSWGNNILLGVSVENKDYQYRIDLLRRSKAKYKFISFEPLIGPVSNLFLEGIDWVIVGGESGPKSRKIDIEWVRYIRDCCIKQKIPFFFKQWGGLNKKKNGSILDMKYWKQYPELVTQSLI
jgi:protein gp37